MAILNDRIKARRKTLNITLLELAEHIGVKEATMQRYESGEIKSIPYDNIVKIAEYLNCTPQYLMGWSDTIHPDLSFSVHEIELIRAYRNQPAMQEAVDKLLGVPSADMDIIASDIVKTVNNFDTQIQKARSPKSQK